MSTSPDSESPGFELDLDLQFLPAWAQQSPDVNRFAKYQGEPEGERRRDRQGDRRGPRDERRDRPRGDRPEGDRGRFRDRHRDRPGKPGERPGGQRPPRERQEAPIPLPDWSVSFLPEEKGVESLARQIKLTGRAYPLFEIAFLVLKKPERYHVQFSVNPKPGEQPKIYVCVLDDTIWPTEEEAVQHLLNKHFGAFYQAEKIPTDPPKGTYTFVAQCGMSGMILGPPNYHDYQTKLRKLHAERFSRMPFETFKARIKIVREEAVVKKWLEEQSFRTEYICLNLPEPLKLGSREEVEKHFRQVHLPNVVRAVESHSLPGTAAQTLASRPVTSLLRRAWDEQMRFPIKVVNVLSQQFARQGLQFFKVNKTVTHVAVARPRYLDLAATPVSESVQRIVQFIDANANCTRRKLIEAFAPQSALAPAAKPEGAPAEESTPPTPELANLISDLHWLVHQGHVIEFSNGRMETAKRPAPKPQKEPPAPPAEAAPTGTVESTATPVSAEAPAHEEAAPVEQSPAEPEPAGSDTGEPQATAEAASAEEETVPSEKSESTAPS